MWQEIVYTINVLLRITQVLNRIYERIVFWLWQNLMLFVSKRIFDTIAVWQGAESCWKVNESLGNRSLMENINIGPRLVSMYFVEFNAPWITWRQPIPSDDTLEKNHNTKRVLQSSSHILRLTNFRLSEPNNDILVSSF